MRRQNQSFFHRLWRDQSGISFIYTAIMLPIFIGFAAITFDIGYALNVQSRLQIVAQAAAMAGAQVISETCSGCSPSKDASAMATQYLNANWATSLTNSTPTLTITPKCLVSPLTNQASSSNLGGAPCSSSATTGVPLYNALSVQAKVTSPTFFANIFGYKSVTLSVTAYAAAKGSAPPPLNVMFIVDSTKSMGNADSTCSGGTKILCALTGVQDVLAQLWPNRDQVGLMTFPGLTTQAYVADDYSCSGTAIPQSGGTSPYYAGLPSSGRPIYQIIGSNTAGSIDYRTQSGSAPPSSGLNATTSSNLLNAVGAGHGCSTKGLQVIGQQGTYYADVITAAQAVLTAWNTQLGAGETRQNVIIFLSDGDANATNSSSPNNICCSSTPQTGQTVQINFQCHEAVAAAQAAATAGTWVYSIAYGSEASGTCSTDNSPTTVPPAKSPPAAEPYSACQTMTNIASDPTKFYSDDANGCASPAHPSITTLSAIFTDIGNSLTYARLIDSTIFAGATQ